jgi:cytoskeletal protein CcmA (bactofilin family)
MHTTTLARRTFFGAAALLLLFPVLALALEMRAHDQPTIGANETIAGDIYIAGGSVTHLGKVEGDFVGAGGTVLVQGPVGADVMVSGGTVTVVGPVADDVRVAGGNVTVNSLVTGDVVAFGGQLTIAGHIGGDVVAYGGTIRIDAPVTGDVRLGGGNIYINAPIAGTVRIDAAEKVTLGQSAAIAGDLIYSSASEASVENGARVEGATAYTPRPDIREAATEGLIAFLSLWFIAKFFMMLVAAMLVGLIFKRYATELGRRALVQPLPEFATGLVTVIVLPIISGILLVTIVGIPLGLLGLFLFAAMLVFGGIIAPIVLGSLLNSWIFTKPIEVSWKTILMGVAAFYLAGFVPFVGTLARLFFFFLALGAALRFKWGMAKEWR